MNPSYDAAMTRPISCTGMGDCKQGRAPCRSPLTCSGMPADEAIEHFRLHRLPIPVPPAFTPPADDGPSLLASPEFWIAGAVCLVCWVAAGLAFVEALSATFP